MLRSQGNLLMDIDRRAIFQVPDGQRPALALGYIHQSEHDVKAARLLLNSKMYAHAARSALEGVEKALKAVIMAGEGKEIRIHNLRQLLSIVRDRYVPPQAREQGERLARQVTILEVQRQRNNTRYPEFSEGRVLVPTSVWRLEQTQPAIESEEAIAEPSEV